MTLVPDYEKNDHFFSYLCADKRVFWLKTRLNAQKVRKISVFCSLSGTAIVSETRSFFVDFMPFSVRLNAFLKNFVCLGTFNFRFLFTLTEFTCLL
jgi:hypothetical protein